MVRSCECAFYGRGVGKFLRKKMKEANYFYYCKKIP